MPDAFLVKIIIMFAGAMGLLFLQVFQNSREYRRTAIALMLVASAMIVTPLALTYLKL
ncbi:MAG: hypothetical protein KBC33_01210 [Candidatus Pacebacteria bacterium]|nr:hypothetical protein [Candidatus Paceibacterota bacterium]